MNEEQKIRLEALEIKMKAFVQRLDECQRQIEKICQIDFQPDYKYFFKKASIDLAKEKYKSECAVSRLETLKSDLRNMIETPGPKPTWQRYKKQIKEALMVDSKVEEKHERDKGRLIIFNV